ncbi:bifunctional tetrahydrofolate synthase/dihydrofolate synthase [Solimonas sp. C16B3]|uniref:Dihydrofolate synthase/folylpolyglutamate synthase n=1 Tax=Solimonas marina TaxID=2714601 RepID=A0A970B6C1_9GAMM|nr:bifunctional tetrahydrofolate synthase/dihydrofolate synthase [Solimonas marina]NKF24292.1 bifunctional tetrahydrofolate synthase/dihydrofolate synthase [Solimonas marina]
MQTDRSLDDWLRLQESIHPKSIELGLDRVRRVAARLDLLRAVPFTVTIAGTNGKGSSATLTADIYRAAGYRVGLYTSPHVLRYNERVQIDGQAVADGALCAAFEAIDAARGDDTLTYFEFGTLAALWLFRAAHVEVQVLEVGLGGRLDAVNIVNADLALLTNVGLDHQDWLGDTRDEIGREKAGIFRARRPAVIVDPEPPASVLDVAERLETPTLRLGRDFEYRIGPGRSWSWRGGNEWWTQLPPPALAGPLQYRNAAGVFALIHAGQAQRPVRRDAFERALQGMRLRGRCESYRGVLLDVAHNAEAAQAFASFLADQPSPRALVLGMLADKPAETVATTLAPVVDQLYTVGLSGPRGLTAEALQERLAATGVAAQACDNMESALREARQAVGSAGCVAVTGSFLTVAAAINELDAHE